MKEKVLIDIDSVDGKGELSLTNQRVVVRKEPVVKYNDDAKEISLDKISGIEVREMDLSASFVFNWMGMEIALLLIFFGLTSASLPLYHAYRAMMGSPSPNQLVQLGRLIISIVMVGAGLFLIPYFDAVILRIKSMDGKTLRYVKNVRYRSQIEKFKSMLIEEVQKIKRKK